MSDGLTTGPGLSSNESASAIVEQAKELGDWRKATQLWSYIDEDIEAPGAKQISAIARQAAVKMRLSSGEFDYPRICSWQLPDDVVAHLAIAYSDDNDRGHYLDVFAPRDADSTHTYPVVIDDHGGGFVYGLRELNRSFAMHLAHRGYVVVLPSYRPGPVHDFVEILTDLSRAYSWTLDNISRFGGDTSRLFLTGDSAGACMALHSALIEKSEQMSAQTTVPQSGIDVKGLLLVCGVYNLSDHFAGTAGSDLGNISQEIFGCVKENFAGYDSTQKLLSAAPLPPTFINTASDDFLHDENVDLAQRLENLGVRCELDDADAQQYGVLGHVYVVGLATHERSQQTLDKMDAFMRAVLAE